MAAPTKQRFYHIFDFKHGTSEHNTIKEVSWQENTEEIADSGDNDAVDTFLEQGKSECRGSVTISDPIQAYTLKAAAKADITFKGKAAAGGTDVLVTIKGVRFFNVGPRAMHNGVWGNTVTFRAHDPAGGALVTVAPVSGA